MVIKDATPMTPPSEYTRCEAGLEDQSLDWRANALNEEMFRPRTERSTDALC